MNLDEMLDFRWQREGAGGRRPALWRTMFEEGARGALSLAPHNGGKNGIGVFLKGYEDAGERGCGDGLMQGGGSAKLIQSFMLAAGKGDWVICDRWEEKPLPDGSPHS